jgi:hypothetical protein
VKYIDVCASALGMGAHMGEMRNSYKILVREPERKGAL